MSYERKGIIHITEIYGTATPVKVQNAAIIIYWYIVVLNKCTPVSQNIKTMTAEMNNMQSTV